MRASKTASPLTVGTETLSGAITDKSGKARDHVQAIVEKTQSFGLGRYPIGFWNYTNLQEHGSHMNDAAVEEWADAGFTVPQSPDYDPRDPGQKAQILRLLDCARAHGMKLILCDPRGYARRGPGGKNGLIAPDYDKGIRAAVEDFGGHPAAFGFHVGDEPDAEMKNAFFACCRKQKEIAPHLHPYANLVPCLPGKEARVGTDTWPNYLDAYLRETKADLIGYDCYEHMNPDRSGWNDYYESLRLYREAALRNGTPFWNTVLSVGHYHFRCPNHDEIRWQFNTSIASGANGLLWFFYYMRQPHGNFRLSPVNEHWDRTETYYNIRHIQKSFHRFYGDLFTRLVSTRVTFHPEPWGGGEAFTSNDLVSRVSTDFERHPILIGEFTDIPGHRYVMLVNNSMTESTYAGLTFPGPNVRTFSWNWAGEECEGAAYCCCKQSRNDTGLTLHHFLAPGQEAVYRVESGTSSE